MGWGSRLNKNHELSCSLLLDCKCNVASSICLHHDLLTMMGCIHALGAKIRAFYPSTGQRAKMSWASDKANKLQKGSGLEVQRGGCLSCMHLALGSVPTPHEDRGMQVRSQHFGSRGRRRQNRKQKLKEIEIILLSELPKARDKNYTDEVLHELRDGNTQVFFFLPPSLSSLCDTEMLLQEVESFCSGKVDFLVCIGQ